MIKCVQEISDTATIGLEFKKFTVELNFLLANGDNEATTILKYIGNNANEEVEVIKNHLSWGEKNAFALILFMFNLLKKNPDLIVLDDPISSFDSHKKFAIIHRLFDKVKPSFYRKI